MPSKSKESLAPVAPRFLCPHGDTLIADVNGFPKAIATLLSISHGLECLDDLAPLIERNRDKGQLPAGPFRAAFEELEVPVQHMSQCIFSMMHHCSKEPELPDPKELVIQVPADTETKVLRKPRKKKEKHEMVVIEERGTKIIEESLFDVPVTESFPEPLPSTDFDESTPQPKKRPDGQASYVKLKNEDSPLGEFLSWDKTGAIPTGCILAQWVGTWGGIESGYKCVLDGSAPSSCVPGSGIDLDTLDQYRPRVTIIHAGNTYVVFAPAI
jgi:hypothetical protein